MKSFPPSGALVLGIETSCDETAAAVLRDGREVLSSVVASQVDMHRAYGGVVPELAFRKHTELINPVIDETLTRAGVRFGDLHGVAVSHGPGLVGALLVGVAAAKTVAALLDVPLLGVNHLEGHVYANFLQHADIEFPLVCLLVSGGHTILLYVPSHGTYENLGETRDDAAGEAFDKVARALGLGYPGGPVVDKMAAAGNAAAIPFPRSWMGEGSLEFSFSGLKTAVMNQRRAYPDMRVEDVCASFQEAVVDVLVGKTLRALEVRPARTVLMAGGVACNSWLRTRMAEACESHGVPLRYPNPALCTDNASMVACAGYYGLSAGMRSGLDLDCFPVLPVVGRA